MRNLARVLLLSLPLLGLTACSSLQSEFDYASNASSTAQIVMPLPLRVMSLNGKDIRLPVLVEYPYTVTVAAGPSTLGFQYGEGWGIGGENELVRSEIMEVSFDARAGERYAVDFVRPETVRYHERAEAYLAGFTAWLSGPQGQQVSAVSTGTRGGFRIDLASAVASVASEDAPSDAPTTVAPAVVTPAAPALPEPVVVKSSRLESLQSLWQSADEEEKKAFMQWIVAPDS